MKLIDLFKRWIFFARRAAPGRNGWRNKRLASRKAENRKSGFIWCDESQNWREGLILDFSAMGARIELRDHTLPLPCPQDWLTLCIPGDDIEVDCRVAWRRGRLMGLHFSGRFRPVTKYPPNVDLL